MNNNYIFNECYDIFNSLETIECMIFVKELLFLITADIKFNIETEKDKEIYKKLEKATLLINEVIEESEMR